MALSNTPVNCVFLYHYVDEDGEAKKHQGTAAPPSTGERTGKRVNSSLVAPGINVFSGGSTTVSCRPLTEFLFTSDDLLREEEVVAMEFSYTEAALLCGCRSGKLRMLSLAAPKMWVVLHTDGFPVFHIISFDRFALSLCADYSFCFWELSDDGLAPLQRRERAHDCELSDGAFCPSKRSLLTCDVNGFCRVWSIREKDLKEQLLLDHSAYGAVTHACCSDASGFWICASSDNFVRGWSVATPLAPPTFQFCVSPCTVTAIAPGHRRDVYIATDDLTIRLIGLAQCDERGVFIGHTQLIRQVSVSPTAFKFVSLQWDGQLYFWLAQHPMMETDSHQKRSDSSVRLPRLIQRTDAGRAQSVAGEEQLISLYDKSRKTLLLKRREGERSLKRMKQSEYWKTITQIHKGIVGAIQAQEAENHARGTTHSI
jgi:hypothetical protein